MTRLTFARSSSRLALACAVACVAACAAGCGGSGTPPAASRAASDTAASAAATPAAGDAPPATTLVVGGRYETQPGTIVCPKPAALQHVLDVAQSGDTTAFNKALEDGRCSPVVAGATVHVAEQVAGAARIRRAGDTTTYWTFASKLSPR